MKSRNKLSLINSASAGIYAFVHLVIGVILPRLIILNYGSEINGLSSSIQQIINYLNYFELGITPIFLFSLYGPLVTNDTKSIDSILSKAKKIYYKVSLFYLIGVLILSPVYPLFLQGSNVDYWSSASLVFVVGTIGLLNIFSLAKYRVLLTADQKVYTLNFLSTISIAIDILLQYIFIKKGLSIVFVKAVPLISISLRTIILRFYVKHKYPNITFKSKETNSLSIKFNDTFVHEIAKTIGLSAPIIALSILTDLTTTSVFAIYSLIFTGLQNLISSFTSGTTASFGHLIREGDNKRIASATKQFTLLLSNILFVLYAAALVLIIPFIKLYLGPIAEIDLYTNTIYPLLFTVWMLVENSKLPAQTFLQASGKYSLIKKLNLVQIVLHLCFSFIFSYFWGLPGAIVSVSVVSFIKLFGLYYYTEKAIVKGIINFNFINLINSLIVLLFLFFLNYKFKFFNFYTIFGFILNGILIVIISAIYIVIFDLIFFRKDFFGLIKRGLSIFKKRTTK